MLLLRLRLGISSWCHHATPTPIFFEFSLLWEGGIMLLLRLSQGISSGCHHATPTTPIFLIIHYCGKRALCFCFDLDRVFRQGATMPHLYPIFLLFIIVGRGIVLLLRLSQGISSGRHHAALKLKFNFGLFIIVGRGHYASAST